MDQILEHLTRDEAKMMAKLGLSLTALVATYAAAKNVEGIKAYLRNTIEDLRQVYAERTRLPIELEQTIRNQTIIGEFKKEHFKTQHDSYLKFPLHTGRVYQPHGRYHF